MLRFGTTLFAAALFGAVLAPPAESADHKVWYVYCEGERGGNHWAVFSKNFWQSPASDSYGRAVGSAAEQFIESSYNVALSGCSGVNFYDKTSAQYSRERTARLHRKMGDRVYFFNIPSNVLRQ